MFWTSYYRRENWCDRWLRGPVWDSITKPWLPFLHWHEECHFTCNLNFSLRLEAESCIEIPRLYCSPSLDYECKVLQNQSRRNSTLDFCSRPQSKHINRPFLGSSIWQHLIGFLVLLLFCFFFLSNTFGLVCQTSFSPSLPVQLPKPNVRLRCVERAESAVLSHWNLWHHHTYRHL